MSDNLKTQVREYTEFFMGTVEPIDLEEIKERPFHLGEGRVRPLASPRRRRGWLAAVAGAAAVLVLGLLTLVSQPSPSPTVATPEPVPSTPVEEPESNPTTVPESELTGQRWCEAPSTWTRVCDDAAGFEGATMSSVTVGGPGMVAVGMADDDAAVWTSLDGFTWSRVPHDESVFGGNGEQVMESVTVGGPGLVAVGTADDDSAVWTSPDGLTWSRVPHDEAVFGGDLHQRMLSVTVAGPGLVAVGADGTQFPYNGNNHDAVAAVWTSPDGFTWSRVPHDESVFGGNGEQVMESVTGGGPGLVAVGWDGVQAGLLGSCCEIPDDDHPAVAAVWTSPDGFTWSRVPRDEPVFGGDVAQVMFSVTVGGPGLVAVGAADDAAAVWTSRDGFTWSRVAHDPAVFVGSSDDSSRDWMASVITGGPGLVAVGSSGHGQGLIEEAVWTSPDGIAWTRLPQSQHGCYAEMTSVTNGFFGLVAVGFAVDCGPDTAAVWHD